MSYQLRFTMEQQVPPVAVILKIQAEVLTGPVLRRPQCAIRNQAAPSPEKPVVDPKRIQ